jgi:ABC-type polysaccharide/polyol phosphate export permease
MHTKSDTKAVLGSTLLPLRTPALSAKKRQFLAALADLRAGLVNSHLWLMLGYHDIKLRYRRSVLGPFWITLSMAITVYSMGFLYGHLFHNNLAAYFPFLTAGMLTWALISTTIIEITEGFINAENLIKQIKLPYSIYVHRIVWRNVLVFFHNLIVIVPIIFIFRESVHVNLYTLLLLPHLVIFYINAFCYGLVLAVIGSRYRDLSQMIKSLVQVAFFMTPIMWNPSLLPENYQFYIVCNPFYDFVELLRTPLLGTGMFFMEYMVIALTTLLGLYLAISLFAKYRSRIVYWL